MQNDRSGIPVLLGGALTIAIAAGVLFALFGQSGRTITLAPSALKSGMPAVAPIGELPPAGGGIVQRPDGRVFIHSGCGSVMAIPDRKGAWSYRFGYRPQPGSPVDETMWKAMVRIRQDRALQQQLKLSAEQISQLDSETGKVLCSDEDQAAVAASFVKYVNAPTGTEHDAAEKSLLECVRKIGEAQGPLAQALLDSRLAVLNDEQRSQLTAAMAATSER